MRPRFVRLTCAAATALSLASVMALTTVAAMNATFTARGLSVAGGSEVTISGMMPGDRAPTQVIELRATGAMRYRMHVVYSGSPNFAETLVMTFTNMDGSVAYRGPLAGANVGGTGQPSGSDPALADGQSATVLVTVMLPLRAGNELQGASLTLSIVVDSFPDPDSQAPPCRC